ncbi:MAG: nitrate- and nitrite sensing domain-containing protein, partial [Litorimonas sp.]
MKIKHRLVAIALAPLLILTVFLGINLNDTLQQRKAAQHTVVGVKDGAIVNALVHELQKERGMSAGFVSSRGAKFESELQAQRRNVDSAWKGYESIAEDLKKIDADLHESILAAHRETERVRLDVTSLQTTVPRLAAHYTGYINVLLDMTAADVKMILDHDVANLAYAYLNVLKAKESAGLERAMGATGFGSGAFSSQVYGRFNALITMQNDHLESASLYASAEDARSIEGLKTSTQLSNIEAIRNVARNSVFVEEMQPVDASDWWTVSTAWIEHLRSLELGMGDTLLA